MRVRIIGSGTFLPRPGRGSPAHWIETGGSSLLLDCGPGTLRALAQMGLSWEKLSHVVITHFHMDHVGGLAPLLFALKNGLKEGRGSPLSILGPPGLEEHLAALSRAHGPRLLEPGFPLRTHELSPGQSWEQPGGDFQIRTVRTRHTENSLGVRVETREASVGFTGDTGPDPNLGPFFQGCQLLLAECSHPEGSEMDTHLTPLSLADLAQSATPDLLVTLHCYPPLDPEDVPRLLAEAGYEGPALTGWDGLSLDLGTEGIGVIGP